MDNEAYMEDENRREADMAVESMGVEGGQDVEEAGLVAAGEAAAMVAGLERAA